MGIRPSTGRDLSPRSGSKGISLRASCSRRRSTCSTSSAPTATAEATATGTRFNVPIAVHSARRNPGVVAPESYGQVTGICPRRSRAGSGPCRAGFRFQEREVEVGGIGVFFPGRPGMPPRRTRAQRRRGSTTRTSPICRSRRVHGVRRGRRKPGGGVPLNGAGQRCSASAVPPRVRPPVRPDRPGRHHARPLRRPRLEGPEQPRRFGRTLGMGDPNSGTNARRRERATRSCRPAACPMAGWSCPTTRTTG